MMIFINYRTDHAWLGSVCAPIVFHALTRAPGRRRGRADSINRTNYSWLSNGGTSSRWHTSTLAPDQAQTNFAAMRLIVRTTWSRFLSVARGTKAASSAAKTHHAPPLSGKTTHRARLLLEANHDCNFGAASRAASNVQMDFFSIRHGLPAEQAVTQASRRVYEHGPTVHGNHRVDSVRVRRPGSLGSLCLSNSRAPFQWVGLPHRADRPGVRPQSSGDASPGVAGPPHRAYQARPRRRLGGVGATVHRLERSAACRPRRHGARCVAQVSSSPRLRPAMAVSAA